MPGLRVRLAQQLTTLAKLARKLSKDSLWLRAFDAVADPTRAGSARYLSLVRYYMKGLKDATARRHADTIDYCVHKGWPPAKIEKAMQKPGPTELANQNTARLKQSKSSKVTFGRRLVASRTR